MKKFNIEHIHADVKNFNGFLYFTVDNKLMRVEVGTPMFNDYNEWRIYEMSISEEDYEPRLDKELSPFEIADIEITENELEYLKLFFTSGKDQSFEERFYDEIFPNSDVEIPCLFANPFSAIIYEGNILKYGIYDFEKVKTEDVIDFKNTDFKEITKEDWINKESITEKNGFYNILILMMEGYVNSYLKSIKN